MADDNNDKRGLASADEETKERVAKAGGEAYHEKRGDHGSDDNTQGQNS
jgi:hypothetical protein